MIQLFWILPNLLPALLLRRLVDNSSLHRTINTRLKRSQSFSHKPLRFIKTKSHNVYNGAARDNKKVEEMLENY